LTRFISRILVKKAKIEKNQQEEARASGHLVMTKILARYFGPGIQNAFSSGY
jgi:hypothetical protein